jgi:BioD-like phosphotransacetylase family protein
VPSFHDEGTHIVAIHKVDLDLLKFISENDDVLEITGDYTGVQHLQAQDMNTETDLSY